MHCLKIHRSYRNVVAICDKELLGKKFFEGKRQLDVRENFYKDQEVDQETLIRTMIMQRKEDSTFNIVGTESVSLALQEGIISENCVGKVSGVPFALLLL